MNKASTDFNPANQTNTLTSVLMVSNFLSASGGSRGVCEELSQRFLEAGWHVVTTSDKPNKLLRLLDMLVTTWRRRHQYGVAQVDVFSGSAFLWAELVCWLLRRLGKPYVLTLHGGNLPNFAAQNPARVRNLLQTAKTVTVPSRYLYEQMQPYAADNLSLVPNPVELRHYTFRLRETSKPDLVWLRAFHTIYNPTLAVKMLALLVTDFPEVHLTMIGPDKDGSLEAVRQSAAALKVSDHLTLIPGVPKAEVPAALNKGDIFINTTNVDNTPVSVIEALACGLCVVSTNVGGLPYLLKDNHDALLVPPDSAEALAVAVRRILTAPGLSRQLSQNARATVSAFDWSVVLPEWKKLLAAGGE